MPVEKKTHARSSDYSTSVVYLGVDFFNTLH